MVDQPLLYKPHPSLFPVMLLGGFTGTVLLTAALRLTASRGAAVIDLPLLMGGLFSGDQSTAFTAGHALFLVAGILVLLLLALLWPFAPGSRFTFRGALVRAGIFGLGLFVLGGILVPLLGGLSRLPAVSLLEPGPFGVGLGLRGPLQLLLATQLYALTAALVAAMPQGLQPMDAVGWGWWSHSSGESP
ncbi:hypothetical protein [Pseudonocardia nigra]|uniref:hypothetical protein n=1 Tax=Pseudonocardia nigra TaxID=1921578 RepID=UPI001C5EF6E3|nr:hypothetical protein [Pseudonocardia nigra]